MNVETQALEVRNAKSKATRTNRKPWMFLVSAIGIALLLVMPSYPQGNGKGGGGGGSSDENPLMLVFRDATGDLVGSDGGGAYIDGEAGVQAVLSAKKGDIYFSVIREKIKGKLQPPARYLGIDLDTNVIEDPADLPNAPFTGSENVHAAFHVAGDDNGIRDVNNTNGATTGAAMPIFGESGSLLEGWKLSYTDSSLEPGSGYYGERVTVTCVREDQTGVCIAWLVDKPDTVDPDTNDPIPGYRAALVNIDGGNQADAGIWRLPFAIAVCRTDDDRYVNDDGTTCSGDVFGN